MTEESVHGKQYISLSDSNDHYDESNYYYNENETEGVDLSVQK